MSYRCLLLISLLLPFLGCEQEIPASEEALSISPLPVEAGKPMQITYYPDHPKAMFRDSSDLYATVVISTAYSVKRVRMLLATNQRDNSRNTSIDVPIDAVNIEVSVGPEGRLMFTETFASVVAINGKSAEHGLPRLILTARTYDEGLEYFRTDAELYPDTPDRFLSFWRNSIQAGRDTASIKNEIDSVFHSVQMKKARNEHDITALTACATARVLIGDFPGAGEALKILVDSYRASMRIPLSAQYSLSYICSMFFNSCVNNVCTREHVKDKNAAQGIIPHLISIAIKAKNHILLNDVLRIIIRPGRCETYGFVNTREFIDSAFRIAMEAENETFIGHTEILIHLSNLLCDSKQYDLVRKLVDRHSHAIQESTKWLRDSPLLPVSSSPEYGCESELTFLYGMSCMKMGLHHRAASTLTKLSERKVREENIYAMCRAVEELTDHYLKASVYDSAARYCAYALILDSRNCDALFDKVQKKYNNLTKETLISQYYTDRLSMTKALKKNAIAALDKNYSDSLIILFSSRSCSVCRKVYPDIIKKITEGGGAFPPVLLVTDEEEQRAREVYQIPSNGRIHIACLSNEIVSAFEVRAYPTVVVIRDKMILYHGGANKEGTVPIIERTLRRRSNQ